MKKKETCGRKKVVAKDNDGNVDFLITCYSFEFGLLLMNKMHKRIYWSISGIANKSRYIQVHIPVNIGPIGLQLCRSSMLHSVFRSNKWMVTKSELSEFNLLVGTSS